MIMLIEFVLLLDINHIATHYLLLLCWLIAIAVDDRRTFCCSCAQRESTYSLRGIRSALVNLTLYPPCVSSY